MALERVGPEQRMQRLRIGGRQQRGAHALVVGNHREPMCGALFQCLAQFCRHQAGKVPWKHGDAGDRTVLRSSRQRLERVDDRLVQPRNAGAVNPDIADGPEAGRVFAVLDNRHHRRAAGRG